MTGYKIARRIKWSEGQAYLVSTFRPSLYRRHRIDRYQARYNYTRDRVKFSIRSSPAPSQTRLLSLYTSSPGMVWNALKTGTQVQKLKKGGNGVPSTTTGFFYASGELRLQKLSIAASSQCTHVLVFCYIRRCRETS